MDQPSAGDSLIPCATCERKFNAKALERHSKICIKVFQTKRKAFDTAEQRKATDASGKGIEEEQNRGFKPRMPGNKKGTASSRAPVHKPPAADAGGQKIPKWKL